jgi:hypothetical protein
MDREPVAAANPPLVQRRLARLYRGTHRVLEYIILANWVGGPHGAAIFGNPSVDFIVFHERNWSTASSF